MCQKFFAGDWQPASEPDAFVHHQDFHKFREAAKVLGCRLCIALWDEYRRRQGWKLEQNLDTISISDFELCYKAWWGYDSDDQSRLPHRNFLNIHFEVFHDSKGHYLLEMEMRPATGERTPTSL
jgi:hypothetical protein